MDTGAVLERELAQRAGLGWYGRNTMLIQPRRGSYWFLGVILLDVELAYDAPFAQEHCGTCSACVTACPTGALLGRDESGAPRMDARRCISYLTIELRGPIPRDLRPLIGNRVYGCDICQEVCPWNSFATPSSEEAFLAREGLDGPSLIEWMTMTQEEFSARFKGSPIKRAKRRGLLRNVAVALGNWGVAGGRPRARRRAERRGAAGARACGVGAGADRHGGGGPGAAGEGRGGGGCVGAGGDRGRVPDARPACSGTVAAITGGATAPYLPRRASQRDPARRAQPRTAC